MPLFTVTVKIVADDPSDAITRVVYPDGEPLYMLKAASVKESK